MSYFDKKNKWDFWIDRGGTFTDVVARDPYGSIHIDKLLSDNLSKYKDAGIEAIKRFLKIDRCTKIPASRINSIKMGTTVATNALLERKGEPVVLLITKGLRDQLRIAYQNRPNLFDRKINIPETLYEKIIEVEERISVHGEIINPLNKSKTLNDLSAAKKRGFNSCAIVLMHSCKFNAHETQVRDLAFKTGFSQVSVSHETSQIMKLVMRGDTTVADAYLTPILNSYIKDLNLEFKGNLDNKLSFMQSNGGLTGSRYFFGKDSILSGPAGGVIGGIKVSEKENQNKIIGFDMGGTSTDVWHYAGELERNNNNMIDGVRISVPMLSINTIAAGGGSVLKEDAGRLQVGPESAGANPGPACYGRNGPLTITDSNLITGRINPSLFPKSFGQKSKSRISLKKSKLLFNELTSKIGKPIEEIAEGFLSVADNNMAEAIKKISVQKGHHLNEYCLTVFGGAGGQHACSIAEILEMKTCLIHPRASVLSAYGMGLAELRTNKSLIFEKSLNRDTLLEVSFLADNLITSTMESLESQGVKELDISFNIKLFVKLQGTDACIDVKFDSNENIINQFNNSYFRLFGFKPSNSSLIIESVFVEAIGSSENENDSFSENKAITRPNHIEINKVFINGRWTNCKFFKTEYLDSYPEVYGPAVIYNEYTSILLKEGWKAEALESGTIKLEKLKSIQQKRKIESALIEVFNNLFMSIAEQMGFVLEKTAQSITIKERLDFSCAIFDDEGELIANAPHMPVHLGSMDSTVKSVLENNDRINYGDIFAVNAPYNGGTHLPDITIVKPIWNDEKKKIIFFTAARGHHTDIGGLTPGSMPCNSRSIEEEGVYIDNWKIVENFIFDDYSVKKKLLEGRFPARAPDTNIADLKAQIAACKKGAEEIEKMVGKYSLKTVMKYQKLVRKNAELAVREAISKIKNSKILYKMDDDLNGEKRQIKIELKINKKNKSAEIDFTGTTGELSSNYNAPLPVTSAAILYSFRILTGGNIPMNSGIMKPIKITVPPRTMLSPKYPAAVIAGNVETSQAVTSALLMCFGIQAASQSTMNNITWGNRRFQYYETICGGTGAGVDFSGKFYDGTSAVHSHMTNSRLTDPEILEFRFPVILEEFCIRKNSGGKGKFVGGNGVIRKIRILEEMTISVLSGHRTVPPPGILGGDPGKTGSTTILKGNGVKHILKYADQIEAKPNDILIVKTPGGGGIGKA